MQVMPTKSLARQNVVRQLKEGEDSVLEGLCPRRGEDSVLLNTQPPTQSGICG